MSSILPLGRIAISRLVRDNTPATSERHNDPCDQALFTIVAMGFTPDEARRALMRTDNGVHHSVHLAVEYLLSVG
jgi:hypothetical protein